VSASTIATAGRFEQRPVVTSWPSVIASGAFVSLGQVQSDVV
jgi:ABC-type uncharacterized transport system substrate-binding protein